MFRSMERSEFIRTVGLGAAGLAALPLLQRCSSAVRRPNIVLILADDMGYSDLGCYGGEIATPNLDRLAARGMKFTQFYNAARCCPTRAALLTGLYPHQTGVGHMTANRGWPAYQGYLNDQCVTLAEALKGAGYQTCMSGKWHVGNDPAHHPIQRGFQHYYGLIPGSGNYFLPETGTIWENDAPVQVPQDGSWYATDAYSDYAANFIGKAAARSHDPFFLYLSYTAPHYPLQAWPEDIAKYRGRYRKGWDQLREERYRRLLDLGMIDARWPLSPRDGRNRPWEELSEEEKDWRDELMAVYAAMVDRLDQVIGQVMAKLKEVGAEENTLVTFVSDNGACPYTNMWGDQPRTDSQGRIIPVGGPQATYAYGWEWANAGNTPFRKYKRYIHEGGIATPFIAYWPAGIQAGQMADQVGHVIDVLPTCLELAGAAYPDEVGGRPIIPAQGQSLLPVFQGRPWEQERTLYWEPQGHRGVRHGNWKLVAEHGQPWDLYDLAADRTEMVNLALGQPGKAQELLDLYTPWAEGIGVRPWPVRSG